MLCDAPSLYRKEPEVPAFISKIPVVWDETIAPEARIKEYLLMARRNQKNWYVAAMTNQEARNMQINLSFLDEGDYEAVIFMDGANADKNAADYKIIRQKVNNQSIITANLAPGGGWTAIFTPVAEK
jgi:alpha-glucosidase